MVKRASLSGVTAPACAAAGSLHAPLGTRASKVTRTPALNCRGMIWLDYYTGCAATRCIGDFTDVPVIEVHVRPGDSIGVDDAVARWSPTKQRSMAIRASRCLATKARGPPILRGAPRQENWDYPVASSFVRWRTEQWEGNPIACDCESSFQANNGSVRLSLTTQSSDLAFEPEHGKCAQLLSLPARSLARALPPLLRAASKSPWEPTPIWWRYRVTRFTTPRN